MRSEAEVCAAIDRYGDMVARLCAVYLKNSPETEDVFQRVFLKYTLSTKVFESPEQEKAWLLRVAANCCKDTLKSFFRRRTVSLEEQRDLPSAGIPEDRIMLREALNSLPRKYREVIYLHFYEGYTAVQIGQILGRNPNTVYTHLNRAKEMLKKKLGGAENG